MNSQATFWRSKLVFTISHLTLMKFALNPLVDANLFMVSIRIQLETSANEQF